MIQPGQAVQVPARYEFYLRSVLTHALAEIAKDTAAPGSSNELPAFAVFEQRTGTVMLLLIDVEATPVVTVRDVLAQVGKVAA